MFFLRVLKRNILLVIGVCCGFSVLILWELNLLDNVISHFGVSIWKHVIDCRNLGRSERFSFKTGERGNYSQYLNGLLENRFKSSYQSTTIVLLWTPFFGDRKWGQKQLGVCQTKPEAGNHSSCTVTDDRSRLCDADVVLFHCRDQIPDKCTLRRNRQAHQVFIVLCHESPSLSSLKDADTIGMNASATYRMDSDFPLFYGRFEPKSTKGNYSRQVAWPDKKKSVVWMCSNCAPLSQREKLARELSKHIDLDIYGACGKRRCSQGTRECFKQFAKQYKFYLSFENSVCEDYVTEKLFLPMGVELVPVVYGGANYSLIAPDHSYINARDFTSPKHLAHYLKQVGNDQTLYNKYLTWKNSIQVAKPDPSAACKLCEAFRKTTFTKKAGPLEAWWKTDTCHNDYMNKWQRHW